MIKEEALDEVDVAGVIYQSSSTSRNMTSTMSSVPILTHTSVNQNKGNRNNAILSSNSGDLTADVSLVLNQLQRRSLTTSLHLDFLWVFF